MPTRVFDTQKGNLFDKLLQLNERIQTYFLELHVLINCEQINLKNIYCIIYINIFMYIDFMLAYNRDAVLCCRRRWFS